MKKLLPLILGLCLIFVFSAAGCKSTATTNSSQNDLESKKATAVAVVHSSAVGLGAVLGNYQSESDRTNFLRSYADPIKFYPDQTGYFFIYNFDCLNIALPNPKELEGTNLYNHQDSKGNYPIRQMSALAQKGGGFAEYYWIKPGSNSTTEERKISYVEPIPGTQYFIGAGVYSGK
jgi:signal transduction histidine kinase